MPYKAVGKYALWILPGFTFCVLCLMVILPGLVEFIVESRLPDPIKQLNPGFSINHIGIDRTIVSDIRLGQDISIDFARLDYTWRKGKGFQVTGLTVTGLGLDIFVDPSQRIRVDRFVVPGSEKPDNNAGDNKQPGVSRASPGLFDRICRYAAFVPKRLQIKNSLITVQHRHGSWAIPLDFKADLDTDRNVIHADLVARPMGQKLVITAGVDLEAALGSAVQNPLESFELQANGLHPGCLAGFLPPTFPLDLLTGAVDVNVRKNEKENWEITLSGLTLQKANLPQLRLAHIRAQVEAQEKQILITGAGSAVIMDEHIPPLPLDITMQGRIPESGLPGVSVSIDSRKKREICVKPEKRRWPQEPAAKSPETCCIEQPVFHAELSGTTARQTGRLEFSANAMAVQSAQGTIRSKSVNVLAHLDRKGQEDGFFVDIEGQAKQIQVKTAEADLAVPDTRLSGKIRLQKTREPAADMNVALKDMTLNLVKTKVAASGIDLGLAFRYPFYDSVKPGYLDVTSIRVPLKKHRALEAGFKGRLRQTGKLELALDGRVLCPDLPDTVFNVSLDAGMDKALAPWVRLEAGAGHLVVTEADMGRILPGTGFKGHYRVDVSPVVHISFKENILDTAGQVQIHGGRFEWPDMGLKASGLSGLIRLNDLVTLESVPGQELFIDSVSAGQLRFDNGAVRFSLEDGQFLNIENFKFNWCNGTVSTESIRLPGSDKKLALTLYCDRLELDSLLRQMGAFDAQGGGTLSGRIPVVYKAGEISFDNGFLFSTPGQGGRVVVRDLNRMLTGFPKGTREFSQLDLAAEALKDFEYNWATLRMNTYADTLDVRMELDGKPARILPFEYKKQVGAFIRVDASSPGSRFQGIKLDTHLKLPFNRVMKFGTKLKSILN